MHYHHHNWYHGCWSGHSGSNWYAPLAWGAVGWGLGALTTSWGYPYSYTYANPYYVPSTVVTTPVYDYSQPIVINDYSTSTEMPVQQSVAPTTVPESVPPPLPEEPPEVQQGYDQADQARASFRAGNFTGASAQIQQAIAKVPGDPVLHEFSALCMFAMQDYQSAAAVLNNLMATAPGMDWTTMSSLYPSVAVYEKQLDSLEAYCKSHPTDPASHFVLAYHRLVCGEPEAAIDALEVVVQAQPKDVVAKRMLTALRGDQPAPSETTPPAAEAVASDTPQPTTDLIGPWEAKRDDATFELQLDEEGRFAWKSSASGEESITLAGSYTLVNDLLVLESAEQGAMIGRTSPVDADHFRFVPVDSPPDDPGLSFGRTAQ